MKILIIGGVAGGASAAARLRRLEEKADIILFERGEHISFANCGLPYYVGGIIESEADLLLQTPESFCGRFCVDVRVNSEVMRIDRESKKVEVKNLATGETYWERYDKLILSPGARPVKPPIPGIDLAGVFTLRNVPDASEINRYIAMNNCKRAVVVGGGNIGVEMTENLRHKGLETTLIESASHIIPALDPEIAAIVQSKMEAHDIRLFLNSAVTSIVKSGNGLCVTTSGGTIETDIVLLSVGVVPDSHLAKDAGLAMGVRGSIAVNDQMQTSDPDIYAVGDVVEVTEFITGQKRNMALAGPANRQGRIAADHIAGLNSTYTGTQGSSITKVFDLTVACTGISETIATEYAMDTDKIYLHAGAHAGYYPGAKPLTAKVVFERKTGRILGGQFIGVEGADKRCDVLAVAIRAGMDAAQLTGLELCYAPPYSSAKDLINIAGFAIENIVAGRVNNAHWENMDTIDRENAVLLDVRTTDEFVHGSVPGFINIPLHELRERIQELPTEKPVYVHCFSGLRSYVACCILAGNGYTAYNISGGWFLYQVAFRKELS